MLTFEIVQDLDNCEDAKKIRQEVFIEEQKFKYEFDDIDTFAKHVVAYIDDVPVGCARFFSKNDNDDFRIGRIAVVKNKRKQQLGSKIISFCENEIRNLGGKNIVLSAQVNAKNFYEKLGYVPFSEEYLDEHVPHIAMKKSL